jgi:hypothetical protein
MDSGYSIPYSLVKNGDQDWVFSSLPWIKGLFWKDSNLSECEKIPLRNNENKNI